MREFTYTALELAGTALLVALAASVLLLVYAVLGLPFLTSIRALQRLILRIRLHVAGLFAFVGRPLLPTRSRMGDWRQRHFSDIVDERDDLTLPQEKRGSRVADLFISTFIFVIAVVTTVLLIVVSAEIVGLTAWGGAANILPWLFGVGIVSAMVYATAQRQRRGARWAFGVALATVVLFALLRGIDQWTSNILDSNLAEATRLGIDELPAPWFLTDLRDFLPLPIFVTAEVAIVLGAILAHRGLRGLWLVVATVPTLLVEAVIVGFAILIFALNWIVGLTLLATKLFLDVVTAPSLLLYNWVRTYGLMQAALHLHPVPAVDLPDELPVLRSEPAAEEEPVAAQTRSPFNPPSRGPGASPGTQDFGSETDEDDPPPR